ncbi:MAG: 4-hydroxythreonine-4-phosphate dehydrogenase PdxA [Gammaproteobacteria bacterium]|jgi:4-hydroxythreonine-4-phosphate dehydrogenase|nr:4-hydroxythreonine-4-phosphate dehydrogenase PdxA [Gammaproteobacteria bacterium]MBT3724284.1 4-hydroxythreonine-4-phosphate dehydrogenase PdxA [Gammaproteobacteria bacterium]MBT4196703.1 4-hydroxythreonine-4-phosphate dehydrogenase PdxA [Gammaproteobacteria bacterium]MBT4448525.1 4-hydroxythreonine-4-phosphate dehydrogenase PdxA [Gammaproteobacteria bacterium]MBT4861801.1 4-hydroxythreonine-4-phosphate dehydrogenase PdxA [Gammaproteobacteria bacterium]
MNKHPTIAITSGEPAGIGPELIAFINNNDFSARLVILGDENLLRSRADKISRPLKIQSYQQDNTAEAGTIEIYHIPLRSEAQAGKLDTKNSSYVLELLDIACKGCLSGEFDAMVTAPIQKDIINQAGIPFTGHTEYLAGLCQAPKPVMLLATESLRVALATTHLPLSQVPSAINEQELIQIIHILHHDLSTKFAINKPHIKVCGLNPHAGENGYLGHEEIDIIIPVINNMKQQGINVSGPYPADTVFTHDSLKDADAVLAMYHDQGLPVLKHVGFNHAINTTLGLPIIRTSVDHGTALHLTETGQANPDSLFAAINSAIIQTQNMLQVTLAQE